ncbi:MAG: hypothetical protein M3220_03715, partial [Chloroflexota bacterium]|nr:hypothetical protein [Chloroflexota bacterium]
LPLGLTFVSNLGNAGILAGGPFVSEQLTISLMLWLVLLPLIVGPSLIRDLGEVGEILWTTPLDALTHLLGVCGGLLLALLPALLAHLVAQWLVGYLLLGSSAILVWQYGPPFLLASTIAGVSVAVLLALLLRRALVLLLVWLALWAVVVQASLGFFGTLESVALASPANIFFYNLQLSPSLGLGPARPLVQGLVLWFVGVGVLAALLAVGMAVVADRRRAVRQGLPLMTWIVVAGLLAGGGLLLHSRAVRAQSISPSPANIQPDLWRVEAHTLEVAVDARRDTLVGTSTMRLKPLRPMEEPEVVLRLNPGLAITEVSDEAGQPLGWERVGDGIIVSLPATSAQPLALQLRWQGTPRVPYNDYGDRLDYHFPAFDTPQPVDALLYGGVGYLFRDGDWYPWPWGNGPSPQQATENHLTVRVSDERTLASVPLDDGLAVWDGELPAVLLVLPPSGTKTLDGRTIHFGMLGGTDNVFVRRLEQMAELLPQLSEAVGVQPVPTHIVALPYLHDIVWSGDLLLVPEGTGPLRDDLRGLLLSPWFEGEVDDGIDERALMTVLARAWLANHTVLPTGWVRVRPDVEGIVALTGVPGEAGVVRSPGASDDHLGRWIPALGSPSDYLPSLSSSGEQPPLPREGQDLRTMGNPPLRPDDHLELLALWVAVELADPAVRDADLAVLLAEPQTDGRSETFEPFLLRSLPLDFPVSQGQKAALVEALHNWLEEVSRAQALQLFGEAVREQEGTFAVEHLLETLEQRSGVPIEYNENE